jgi:hypothetical protein
MIGSFGNPFPPALFGPFDRRSTAEKLMEKAYRSGNRLLLVGETRATTFNVRRAA